LLTYKNGANNGTDVGQVGFLSRRNKNQLRINAGHDGNQPTNDGSLERVINRKFEVLQGILASRMDAYHPKKEANHEMMASMEASHERMMACLGKTKSTAFGQIERKCSLRRCMRRSLRKRPL
jgi:hypothetical protein